MKKAVVLGGYGFIGEACMRALLKAGYAVTGVGRSHAAAARCTLGVSWVIADITALSIDAWERLVEDACVVVNASGALQDGAKDDLAAIHETAVGDLLAALAGSGTRLVQISAAGVAVDAATEFLRSKARGDALIARSDVEWVILRPALVFGAQAYGGTALLRAGAALPVEPVVFQNAPIQTVFVDELAAAVVAAASGALGTRFVADVAEPGARPLRAVVRDVRAWLGYPVWRHAVSVPRSLMRAIGRVADGLGWLGWRSPLRTTALRSLETGIVGDISAWAARGGQPFSALDETLRVVPATYQERAFSRLQLILPMAIGVLAVFWLLSGVIGLWAFDRATAVLTESGAPQVLANAVVFAGALVDIALGVAILKRSWSHIAAIGMLVVSGAYLVGAALLAPALWADPLGPMIKVLPSMVLALAVAMLVEPR